MNDTPEAPVTDAATEVTAIADPADATQATASVAAAPLDLVASAAAAAADGSLDAWIVARGEGFLAAIEAIPGEITAELKAAADHVKAAIATALAHL